MKTSGTALESTSHLLSQYRDGDLKARDELIERYLPMLTRWGRGRLPVFGRDLAETDDLVQITFLRALNNLDSFDSRRPGAFLAYLRHILLNTVREQLRRVGRQPNRTTLADTLPDVGDAPVDNAIGRQTLERYEAALEGLPENQQTAVILRIEFGMTFAEIAAELGAPSANAVRMSVSRGLARMAEAMD